MINSKSLLALIPARSGSKRLPGKNILEIMDKPMISWTIEAAINSKYIDHVVVSTDDIEIATICKNYGAEVPFIRPKELAKDTSTSMEVILHALDELKESYDYIILLQPTSPTRNARNIDESVELLLRKNADSIVSVTTIDHPIEWTNVLPNNHSMNNFILQKHQGMRSQDFPKRYMINGAIYLNDIKVLKKTNTLMNYERSFAYIMEKENSIDIDTHFDFMIAETILRQIN